MPPKRPKIYTPSGTLVGAIKGGKVGRPSGQDDKTVIRIDPRHETDAHGWPTDEAIKKATEQVNK